IPNLLPFKILDAPSMRDDFYTNPLTWMSSGSLVVALGSELYIWSEDHGVISLPDAYTSQISVVSSSKADFLAIGRIDGRISCWSPHALQSRSSPLRYKLASGICSMAWASINHNILAVGDECGNVTIFNATETGLHITGMHKAQLQLICGLCFSPDDSQLASGSNDNSYTMMDISNISAHKVTITERYKRQHRAAVKAMAFCPNRSSLLCTGGGSNDKTLRFWHSKTGTLLKTINVKAQVTSIGWSAHCRQLYATFGYPNPEHQTRITVFNVPSCTVARQIEWGPYVRALNSATSPDGTTICVAASDESLRFYDIWSKVKSSSPILEPNLFGSHIIDLHENI
ncbi:hypothetical protein CANCADRAFT_16096, partial [Tortispora caseinolytica NRRL Y-17796]